MGHSPESVEHGAHAGDGAAGAVRNKPETIATLLLALGGPPLITFVWQSVVPESTDVFQLLPFDLALWAILASVLIVVVRVEGEPLASIGLKRPRWTTLLWALGIFVVFSLILQPLTITLVRSLGFSGYEAGLRRMLALPVWYRVLLGVGAGVVEETLYRGYAIERLSALTGRRWLGASLAAIVFGAAHFPGWGPGPALSAFILGGLATLFYLWKRDIVPLIIAHAAGDILGLLLGPQS